VSTPSTHPLPPRGISVPRPGQWSTCTPAALSKVLAPRFVSLRGQKYGCGQLYFSPAACLITFLWATGGKRRRRTARSSKPRSGASARAARPRCRTTTAARRALSAAGRAPARGTGGGLTRAARAARASAAARAAARASAAGRGGTIRASGGRGAPGVPSAHAAAAARGRARQSDRGLPARGRAHSPARRKAERGRADRAWSRGREVSASPPPPPPPRAQSAHMDHSGGHAEAWVEAARAYDGDGAANSARGDSWTHGPDNGRQREAAFQHQYIQQKYGAASDAQPLPRQRHSVAELAPW
jgi:hypothetical protein